MRKYTKEEIEKWCSISIEAAGLSAGLFKPKEILAIHDFIQTAKNDLECLNKPNQNTPQLSED